MGGIMAAQRTPLYNASIRGGAVLQEWHGWELPRVYGGVLAEYRAASERAAIHDSSYVGRIKATGADALDLLHRLSTNDVVSLQPGQGAPTVLTTDRGRILDLLTVLNLGDHVLMLTSPQTRDRVMEWIDKYTIVDDVVLEDVTCDTAMLSVMGPGAQDLLGLTGILGLPSLDLASFSPYQSARVTISGVEAHIIRRDLISLPRFEIVVLAENAEKVWQEAVGAGAAPLGLEAHEALRVEQGDPGYDREMGESYNPLETGLWGSISFTKGCYIGQEVIARLDTYQKVQRHLVSLSFSPDAQPEEGMKLSREGKEVGHLTSLVKIPTTGETLGLGYVRKEAAEVGTLMGLADRDGVWAKVKASILPFGPGDSA
jgi:folate-binding protein YgfZ